MKSKHVNLLKHLSYLNNFLVFFIYKIMERPLYLISFKGNMISIKTQYTYDMRSMDFIYKEFSL